MAAIFQPWIARKIKEALSVRVIVAIGPGQKFLTHVRSIFVALVRSGWVSHLWFGFGFGKCPLKMSNFSIFFPSDQKKSLGIGSKSTWVKGGLASYLLQVKSKLVSGQGPSLGNSNLQ